MKKSEHELTVMIFWTGFLSLIFGFASTIVKNKMIVDSLRVMLLVGTPTLVSFFSGLVLWIELGDKKSAKKSEEKKEEIPEPEHTAVEVLESIATLIRFYGEKMPKKHGEWIVLKLNDGHFFSMDSWNGAIYFMSGDPVYNYWTGFSGDKKEFTYLGLSDKEWRAGDEPPLVIEEYCAYYDKIAAFINEQTVKKRELANANL